LLLGLGGLSREGLLTTSEQFVASLGGPALTLGFFVPDALTIPLPQDALLLFALLGGMNFWSAVAWASIGSIGGGCVGFLLARALSKTAWFAHWVTPRTDQARHLVTRHGPLALAIAALTPLPFSPICWACGALGMRFHVFLTVSQLRIARVALYLWLLKVGVVNVLV
jgi:membrane protein YqaA with SNARE-associated domain